MKPLSFTIDTNEYTSDPKLHEFAKFFGIVAVRDGKGSHWPYSVDTARQLEEIYVWARHVARSSNMTDIKLTVNKLRNKIAANDNGEDLVKKVHNFTRLAKEQETLNKEFELAVSTGMRAELEKEQGEASAEKLKSNIQNTIDELRLEKTGGLTFEDVKYGNDKFKYSEDWKTNHLTENTRDINEWKDNLPTFEQFKTMDSDAIRNHEAKFGKAPQSFSSRKAAGLAQ